jgi:predicted transposase/invertase (TIGR01784 family)
MAVRYLDPRNDIVFKRIFGEHPDILRSFLNALLPLPEDGQIVFLEYLPAEQVPDVPLFKNSIVDVRCRDQKGRQFSVELQINWTHAFLQRVLFNASKAFVRQLERSEKFEVLQPVYGLSLLNDVFRAEPDKFYHHYQMMDGTAGHAVVEGIELIFIELPKFKPEGIRDRKLAAEWLRFLKETGDVDTAEEAEVLEKEVANAAPEIREAVTLAQEAAFTPGQLEVYDRYWDAVRTERTLMSGAEAKGEARGRAEGLAEGLAEGRKRERDLLLKNLLAKGMTEQEARELLGIEP